MQARRCSSSSLTPPSSPPLAAQQPGEAHISFEADDQVSPTWTAPSPTRTLGHSSPELPALSSFSLGGHNPRTPSTVARNDRTDTSYYTASWGSPYKNPSVSFDSDHQASTGFASDDFDDDSSGLEFGLEHLLPSRLGIEEESPNRFNLDHLIPRLDRNASPVQFTLENLIRSRVQIPSTPTRTTYHTGATPRPSDVNTSSAEWVRRFLEDHWNKATNTWLSDDSLGGETGKESEDDIESVIEPPPKRGHKDRNTNKTLNQQDFWRHFSKDQKKTIGKMMASKYADPGALCPSGHAPGTSSSTVSTVNRRSAITENPPVAPPVPLLAESPSLVEQTPTKSTDNTPVRVEKELTKPPAIETPKTDMFLAPPEPIRMQSIRTRKKVVVNGRGCVISVPRDIPRGQPGYPPKPMSEKDVNAKLQRLQNQGYDIRGFVLVGTEAHNRPVWPSEADVQTELSSANSKFHVRVAKKSQWDDYVNSLMEAKLAALGVSLGGAEDIPLPMSRQISSQQHPGMPFSPPLPTSSAGSHRMARHGSVVSTNFPLGPSPGHMSRQSMASPAAFTNPRPNMHMHRHSTFASPAGFSHHAMSPSGTWSPGGYFGSDGRSRSPAYSLSRPDLSGLNSPRSPFGMRSNQQIPLTQTQKDEYLLQMQMQQQQLQAQFLQQQQQQLLAMRPSSTLAEVPEDEAEEDEMPAVRHAKQSTSEIAVPLPRGHHHNISENLEREAANEEYHLEQAIDKQFAEGGDFSTEPEIKEQVKPSKTVPKSTWNDSRPVLHQPQPHSRAHSLATKSQQSAFAFPMQSNPRAEHNVANTSLSENTNPSLEDGEIGMDAPKSVPHSQVPLQVSNLWKDNKFAFSKPAPAAHSKQNSTTSISKLNVEAKEFKFNPAASFSPAAFLTGFNFTPAIKSSVDVTVPHSSKTSVDTASSFNVAAPVFKPSTSAFKPVASTPELKPSGMHSFAFPSSGFDFANSLTFKPDAPAFNSDVPEFDLKQSITASTTFSSKIFGDVNISASDVSKPATRSKAVPIVRPDNSRQSTPQPEEREDEFGRPIPPDGRQKRARRGRADGDDVPKLALQPILPSQPAVEARQNTVSTLDLQNKQGYTPEAKENLSPDGKRAKSLAKSPEPSSLQHDTSIEPMPEVMRPAEVLADDHSSQGGDVPTPTIKDPMPSLNKEESKSMLSASAKSFEFRPQLGTSVPEFGLHITKPSQINDLKKSHISPSRFASRSPASTYRPSDDGSYKTALDRRHHTSYPESEEASYDNIEEASFNDIDAVMQHMNAVGSDFGIERDEHSWEHSSPHKTPHQFVRNDLQPTFNPRSDAPSPSPRRLYAQRNMPGSAMSGQDPFDDERAAVAHDLPIHRLNNANEVPMSDWDEGLLSEGEDRIQTRSRFFDKHVDELMGRLLQNRLGPLQQNLQSIHESLATILQRNGRGRRSMSTTDRLESDADDEDDDIGTDSHYRNRSPRNDRRLQKIKFIVQEALAAHQSPAFTTKHVPADQIRAIMEAMSTYGPQSVPTPASEHIQPEYLKSVFAEVLAAHQSSVPGAPTSDLVQSDMIRSIVAEALASHRPDTLEAPVDIPQPQVDMSEIYQVIGSLKASIVQTANQHLRADDVRDLVNEAFNRQSAELAEREDAQAVQERDARIATLEEMLMEANSRLEVEAAARKVLENQGAGNARLLKVTEEELCLLQQTAKEDEDAIRSLTQDRDVARRSLEYYESSSDDVREKLSSLDAAHAELKLKHWTIESENHENQEKLDSITAENEALVATIEEHRLSADKWRDDVQEAREESEKLRKAMEQARCQAEEATRVREAMRVKFEKLQQDMVAASQQVATERAQWQKNDEDSLTQYEVLSARFEAEGRTRERLERELERLETQEREGMKLRIHLEQTQNHNTRLEETIEQLKQESTEHQKNAERYEHDMREARDAAHVEIRRTRVSMETDVHAANNQVNVVRHELESEVARVRAELDQVRLDADTVKEKHELDLEAAFDLKKQSVQDVHESNKLHLQNQKILFERQVKMLEHEHARALDFAREDKQRADDFNQDKLSLADSKLDHLKDRIALLEEKLQVAKEAANAAIAAASKSPVIAISTFNGPEKISTQALRESIAVLQDQLQEREARIEALEAKLIDFDTEAPAKLKERDTEINWLRELLGVRIDDLNDLINSLAQPAFDRETVRDAAIRIRTNLQMEQSEKERLISGDQKSFPTLSTLSNFASPKAVQIAAAFGNWRKGRGEARSALAGNKSATNSRHNTPSRAPPASAQSFLSGLMTPPTSSLRRTPDLPSSTSAGRPMSIRASPISSTEAGFSMLSKSNHMPRTPPLMRKGSYDQDAEVEPFSESGFYDDESTVDGEMTPIALNFGRELPR